MFRSAWLSFGLGLILLSGSAQAQFGGSDRFFSAFDRNGDGTIDSGEMQNMPERLRDALASQGVRGGISRDEFSDLMPRMMEQMRQSRGGGGPGGPGGPPSFGRGGFGRGGDEDGRGGFGRGGFGRGGFGRGGEGENGEKAPKERPRVTVSMPDQFVQGDFDQDGQIGLYEWKQWKTLSAIGQFIAMDRNRDGFLTPQELKMAEDVGLDNLPAVDIATGGPLPTRNAASSQPAGTSSSERGSVAPAASAVTPPPTDSLSAKLAARYFKLMDSNKNGSVDPEEWEKSQRIKPMFEKAGIDISQPLSEDEFIAGYVKAKDAE